MQLYQEFSQRIITYRLWIQTHKNEKGALLELYSHKKLEFGKVLSAI